MARGRPKGSKNKPKPGGIDKATESILARLGIQKEVVLQDIEHPLEIAQEAEAVISYVKNPKRFTQRRCNLEECGRPFATDYGSVAFCSNKCRKDHLESLGIQWNYQKTPQERWESRFPLVVGPDAYALLQQFAEHVLTNPLPDSVLSE